MYVGILLSGCFKTTLFKSKLFTLFFYKLTNYSLHNIDAQTGDSISELLLFDTQKLSDIKVMIILWFAFHLI